jgi:hypothetical protein
MNIKYNNNSKSSVFKSRRYKCTGKYKQGIGYFKPSSLTSTEFRNLYKEWEEKLAQSGFIDIETKEKNQSGHFNPYFKSNGSTATFQCYYNEQTELYYTLTAYFLQEFNWHKHYRSEVKLFKYLFYLHSEAVSYRAMASIMAGKELPIGYSHLKKPAKSIITKRSVFWMYPRIQSLLAHFKVFVKENYNIEIKSTLYSETKSKAAKVPRTRAPKKP